MEGRFCAICGERLVTFGDPAERQEAICGMCRAERPQFERAMAVGSYDGRLRELLHLLKYEDLRPLAAKLGSMLAQSMLTAGLPGNCVVIPIPLHRRKERQRGFNQSLLLARSVAGQFGFPLLSDCLQRKRETASQTGLTREQRRANLRGAFAVKERARIGGKVVILVDDVFTTGTTAAECTRVLMRAGAKQVFVATVARVLKMEAPQLLPAAAPGVKIQ